MVLVVGGAGYIGSHFVRHLVRSGQSVRVFDNLEKGHRAAIDSAEIVIGDLRQPDAILPALEGIRTVVHFAAYSEVGEGERSPLAFYENNVVGTFHLVRAMRDRGVSQIVFSSTAAVYGEPESNSLSETHRTMPTSVYGRTKLAVEKMLEDCDRAHGIRSVRLRYFNAAGADANGDHGEDHTPESHLIPLVIQAALGRRPEIKVFGTDYPTADGTCVRDYVHVEDLASAHELAVQHLEKGGLSQTFNLGTGVGYSVRQVIQCVDQVIGAEVPATDSDRRPGDPSTLIADPSAINRAWGWAAKHSRLEQIVEDAVRWHRDHPVGYRD
ncbi:MAG: UDP-glucose 4-epimerase GalE [Fimbriimonadaceae bacterium]|nr:UDP-glucose 4-epimerase GalE [Fimbriimonadaceae bacterium]